jgi:hypothetical protein
VVGDLRPLPELQPELPEGIHLRWAFRRDLGFPWYGFYLFRRLAAAGVATCAASQFGGLTPGPHTDTDLTIALGTFHSDQNLVFTDDFAPAGTVEIDLAGREIVQFRLDPQQPSGKVDVKIGFIVSLPPTGGGGGGPGPGGGSGPGGIGSAGGTNATCGCGCDHAALVPIVERVVAVAPGQYRATFGYTNDGSTPISMPIGPENAFFPDPADRGQPALFRPGRNTAAFTVVFDGRPITWRLAGHAVTVSAADATTGAPGGGGTGGAGDGIVVTAFSSGVQVARQVVSGGAGQIVTATLRGDAIDEIRVGSGPARLVDVCVTRTTDPAGDDDWAPVPEFPQPMTLPVRSENYPAFQGPKDRALSENTAIDRITYAFPLPGSTELDKNEWRGAGFDDFYAAMLAIVANGPNVAPFITDHVEDITADPDPNDPNASRPVLAQVSSLDLLLAGSLHPAIAQMLGLYWVDSSTVEGEVYDYLLVADYRNAGAGNVNTILSLVRTRNFTNIDAYQLNGAARVTTPPLAPPVRLPTSDQEGLQAFLLPLFSVPPGAPGDLAGSVGMRWGLKRSAEGKIVPTGPVLYHVWRKTTGRAEPTAAVLAAPPAYQQITEVPIAARDPDPNLPAPPRIPGFPVKPLYYGDGPLIEGWYSYRFNAIDLFGRHSALSEPAPWLDVGDQHVLHDLAVHVLDTIPPPPPVRVQAWLLDPLDDFVIKDAAYTTWRQSNSGIGLRVRWSWGAGERRQAPDTREFRIYTHPDSSLVNANDVTNWSTRVAVVGVGERILPASLQPRKVGIADLAGQAATIDGARVTLGDGPSLEDLPFGELELQLVSGSTTQQFAVLGIDAANRVVTVDQPPGLFGVTSVSAWALLPLRTYEIFLPGATLAVPPVFSLPAPLPVENPIVYSLVGVSAADDKDRPDPRRDLPGPQALTPRIGNEGTVGGPATVVQVRRQRPTPPGLPITQDRLFATRADFHSRSFFTVHAQKKPALSVHVFRALDETLFQVDRQQRFGGGTPSNPANDVTAASLGWQSSPPQRLSNAIAAINALTQDGYDQLSYDALRVLASLRSNDAAFSALTAAPLPNDTPDERGLSDDPDYQADSANRAAYTDILDGRAVNRYFYRTADADGVHNVSLLGTSTPPVFLPETAVPEGPRLLGAVGGDRSITLSLLGVSDPAVDTYRIYRSDSEQAAHDIRNMGPPHIVTVDSRPVPERGSPLPIADANVAPYRNYFYRATALLPSGDETPASAAISARAFDDMPPSEPTWQRSEWIKLDASGGEHPYTDTDPALRPAIAVRFSYASGSVSRALVRAISPGGSRPVSPWLDPNAGATTVQFVGYLTGLAPSVANVLRVRAINRGGIEALSAAREVSIP